MSKTPKSESKGRRGMSLGTVLILVLLITAAGVSLSSLTVYQLRVSNWQDHQARALNLARSVVAEALARKFENLAQSPLDISFAPGDEGRGQVTFDQASGLPYSTDNSAETSARTGWGNQQIPARGIHIVGSGYSGGVTRTVEAVVQNQWFPYAMVTAAPLVSTGDLTVGAVADPASLSLPNPPLLPADLASNASGVAVQIERGLVTGDIQSPGTVSVSDQVTVRGEIREGFKAAPIPRLTMSDFDPEAAGMGYETLALPSYSDNPTVFSGAVRSSGALTVVGDLQLDGALLYVPGDLQLAGSLTGVGILAVDGNLTISGSAVLDGTNQLAILASGDVTLVGSGSTSSYIKGLVYTQGSLNASNVTVWGAVVVDGTPTDQLRLSNSRLIHDPNAGRIEVAGGSEFLLFSSGWVTGGRVYSRLKDGSPPTLVIERESNGERSFHPLDPTTLALDNRGAWESALRTAYIEERQSGDPSWVPPAGWDTGFAATANLILSNLQPYIDDTSWQSGAPPVVSLDPQRLMKPNDQVRLLLWRES